MTNEPTFTTRFHYFFCRGQNLCRATAIRLRIVWVKGRGRNGGVRSSGFGEVYVARDSLSKDLVAIKKVRTVMSSEGIEGESRMLKSCVSKFIVRYYDVVAKENELWVG